MAQVPEEVVINIEADDRATPKLSGVGRSLVLLGSNVSYVARAFGIQNAVVDSAVGAILTLGHIVRAITAAKTILATITTYLAGATAAEAVAQGASAGAQGAGIITTNLLAGAYGRLAVVLGIVKALMHDYVALAAAAAAGAGIGYIIASSQQSSGGSKKGPIDREGVNVNIAHATFTTPVEAGRKFYSDYRKYK